MTLLRGRVLLAALAPLLLAAAADAPTLPAPKVSVSLERDVLVTSDAAAVEVWLSNPSEVPLTDLRLSFAGPGFLRFGTFRGNACHPAQGTTIPLGALAPHEVRSARVCLQTGPEVVEGDFNVVFTLVYRWAAAGELTAGAGFEQVEKKVNVGLFGSENIAGVSLRLGALIVPGLLFFLLLRFAKFPVVTEEVTGTALITLSVVFSVLLIVGASEWLPTEFDRGMSIRRFLELCGLAVGLGLLFLIPVVGGRTWKWWQANKREAALITQADDLASSLEKALRGWKAGSGPVTVRMKKGPARVGALKGAAKGGVVLFGWFEVSPDGNPASGELRSLVEQNRLEEAVRTMGEHGLPLELRNGIYVLTGGRLEDTADPRIWLEDKDISGFDYGAVPGAIQEPPLQVQ